MFQAENGSWPTLKFPFSTEPRPVAKAVVWQADVVFRAVAAPVLVIAIVAVSTAMGDESITINVPFISQHERKMSYLEVVNRWLAGEVPDWMRLTFLTRLTRCRPLGRLLRGSRAP